MKINKNRHENLSPIFVSIFFWQKRDQDRKSRDKKRNQDMQTYGNKQARIESQRIMLGLFMYKFTQQNTPMNIFTCIPYV